MSPEYLKTSSEGFVVDATTRAVINIDNSDYIKILEHRKRAKELSQMNSRVEKLENDISDIKELLIKALNGR